MSSIVAKSGGIYIPRDKYKVPFNHDFDSIHGNLDVVDAIEVVPGDTYVLPVSAVTHMSRPIVPIFGNIEQYFAAFFVPSRLICNYFEQFYGDMTNHDTIQTVIPGDLANEDNILPYFDIDTDNDPDDYIGGLADRFGMPYIPEYSLPSGVTVEGKQPLITMLKHKGYYMIWNEWFRPSNLIKPVLTLPNATADGKTCAIDTDGSRIYYHGRLKKVCKKYDYFTSASLYPIFSTGDISIPLGTFAPIEYSQAFKDSLDLSSGENSWYDFFAREQIDSNIGFGSVGGDMGVQTLTGASSLLAVAPGSLTGLDDNRDTPVAIIPSPKNYRVNLASATAASIQSLKFAWYLEEYLRRANYGSHFHEILQVHYGVTNPDLRLQRPQYLGSGKTYINVSTVVSTADASNTDQTKLGQTGAVSITPFKKVIGHARFEEPGYIYILTWCRYDRSYATGYNKEDIKTKRFEFFSPEFANLTSQPVYKYEISPYKFLKDITASEWVPFTDKDVFGWQESWAEYRYRKNRVSGHLNPTTTKMLGEGSLDVWTLVDDILTGEDSGCTDIDLDFTQGEDFLLEDRNSLARCLVTGENGPDYIIDVFVDYTKTTEVPLHPRNVLNIGL